MDKVKCPECNHNGVPRQLANGGLRCGMCGFEWEVKLVDSGDLADLLEIMCKHGGTAQLTCFLDADGRAMYNVSGFSRTKFANIDIGPLCKTAFIGLINLAFTVSGRPGSYQ